MKKGLSLAFTYSPDVWKQYLYLSNAWVFAFTYVAFCVSWVRFLRRFRRTPLYFLQQRLAVFLCFASFFYEQTIQKETIDSRYKKFGTAEIVSRKIVFSLVFGIPTRRYLFVLSRSRCNIGDFSYSAYEQSSPEDFWSGPWKLFFYFLVARYRSLLILLIDYQHNMFFGCKKGFYAP